jgi:hypothetical protein
LCAIIGIGPALLAAGIHATMYVFVLSSINGLCHAVGYRNDNLGLATNLRRAADRRRGPSQQITTFAARVQLPSSEFDPRGRSSSPDHAALARPNKTIEESPLRVWYCGSTLAGSR